MMGNKELYKNLEKAVNEIIDMKFRMALNNVNSGGRCPWVSYECGQLQPEGIDCSNVSCSECTQLWAVQYHTQLTKRIRERYYFTNINNKV